MVINQLLNGMVLQVCYPIKRFTWKRFGGLPGPHVRTLRGRAGHLQITMVKAITWMIPNMASNTKPSAKENFRLNKSKVSIGVFPKIGENPPNYPFQ